MTHDEPLSESMYLRLKTLWTGTPAGRRSKRNPQHVTGSQPFTTGRDPSSLTDVLGVMSTGLGWDEALAEAALVSDWPNIVGPDTAANAQVERFDDGALVVRCVSTAWATQLGFIASDIKTRLLEAHPDAGLEKITFIGPNAPSWKRGPRAIPGRGARDTYG